MNTDLKFHLKYVDNIFSDILLASNFFQSLISSSVGSRL